MSTVNTKRKSPIKVQKHEVYKEENSHLNYMGGPSYDISNPMKQLRLAASSCFFGEPSYYTGKGTSKNKTTIRGALSATDLKYLRDTLNAIDPQEWRGLSTTELMESTIDKALNFDIEATLEEAVRLRNEENIRTTPQIILVRAALNEASKGTNLIRTYAKLIIKRADEPAVCLAYAKSLGKIPTSLKRALADFLEGCSEYNLAKYRMESHEVKTVDVVNLVHPKHTEAIGKLVKNELKLGDGLETWESYISKNGSNKETWEHVIDNIWVECE